jgi:hypothetical protein
MTNRCPHGDVSIFSDEVAPTLNVHTHTRWASGIEQGDLYKRGDALERRQHQQPISPIVRHVHVPVVPIQRDADDIAQACTNSVGSGEQEGAGLC